MRWLTRAAAVWVVVGSAGCDRVTMGRTPTETKYVLRVQGDGGGSGAVTAPDASPQLACAIIRGAVTGICAMAYPEHSTVQLVATPNAGSTFVGWSGSCAGTDQCVTDMSAERVVTAAFATRPVDAR